MKFFVRIFLGLILCVGAITLVACGCGDETATPKEATAYGIVHKLYIGTATVVSVDGKVAKVTFDEVFLPGHWAAVVDEATVSPKKTVVTKDKSNNDVDKTFAQFIKVGDQVFEVFAYTEAELTALGVNPVAKFKSEKIADLFAYVKEKAENAQWYVEQVLLGNVYACNANGEKLATAKVNPYGSFFKSASNYWPGAKNGALGWAANLQALALGFVGTDMSATPEMVEGVVKIGANTTTATIADYADYYNLAKAALTAANAK